MAACGPSASIRDQQTTMRTATLIALLRLTSFVIFLLSKHFAQFWFDQLLGFRFSSLLLSSLGFGSDNLGFAILLCRVRVTVGLPRATVGESRRY